jgi:hypothetical protein
VLGDGEARSQQQLAAALGIPASRLVSLLDLLVPALPSPQSHKFLDPSQGCSFSRMR